MPQLAFCLDFSAVPHRCPSLEEAPAPVLVFHLHPNHPQVLEVGFLELYTRTGGRLAGLSLSTIAASCTPWDQKGFTGSPPFK